MGDQRETISVARPFRFAPICACCGSEGASVEVIAPGGLPQRWADWSDGDKQLHLEHTDATRWRWIYQGIVGGNGVAAGVISEERVCRLLDLLYPEPTTRDLPLFFHDSLGWCSWCASFYCAQCWSGSGGGFQGCPQGHGQSMDPYW